MIKNLKYKIAVIFKPSYWFMNYETNKAFDKYINKCLDNKCIATVINTYYCEFGGLVLWIENRPYACLTSERFDGMPSRATVLRFLSECKAVLG